VQLEQAKEFNWTIIEMGEDSMVVKVDFESPGFIS